MYNNVIKKKFKKDFKSVIESLLKQLFDVRLEDSKMKRIYVDLNSALSIIFRYENINDEDIITFTRDAIENFLLTNLKFHSEVILLYSLESSIVHTAIYPEWCKERDGRVRIVESDFIKKLLYSFKRNEGKLKVRVVNTRGIHPAILIYKNELKYRTRSIILSRDCVFRCMTLSNVVLWNGVSWINPSSSILDLPDKIELDDPNFSLPYYYTLRGDKRNEYKGFDGYGPVRTVAYLKQHRLKLKADLDHPNKEFIDKHLPLYNIELMVKKAEEMELDVDKLSTL